MSSLEPSLKDIRDLELCELKTCRGCIFLEKCFVCGEQFCGMTRFYEEEWGRTEDGDALCPLCYYHDDEMID